MAFSVIFVMKAFLKTYKLPLLLAADGLLILGCILGRWLSGRMLESDTVCLFLLLGGKCLTCGGTHFVQSFLSGQLVDAWHHNEFLFINTAYLAISLVPLHLWVLFGIRWAKKILRWMYSIPTLILFLVGMLLFIILRNITPITWLLNWLLQR